MKDYILGTMRSLSRNGSIGEELKRLSKLIVVSCLFMHDIGCTTAPNGAINVVKPVEDPEGYVIYDRYYETNHIYNQPIITHHMEKLTLFCKKHRKWEVITPLWDQTNNNYYYLIKQHKRFK